MGSKKVVGPLLTEMISYDWIVVSVNYRLNSKAGYPTQLMDCKRALRWVKDQIRVFGGNPNNIVVAGDSAGGHMACLLASTANQPGLQPGFEDVDTTIQGVLGLSAVVNLVDPEDYCNHDCRTRFIKEVAKREGSPESEASTYSCIIMEHHEQLVKACLINEPTGVACSLSIDLRFLAEHSPTFQIKRDGVPYMMIQ
jgi:acetyl esterase/lipase